MASNGEKKELFSGVFGFFESFNVAGWVVVGFLFFVVFFTVLYVSPPLAYRALEFIPLLIVIFGPIILPLILFRTAHMYWLHWKRAEFVHKQGSVLLEIILPREIYKSPAAMELALMQMHQASAPTWLEAYMDGKCLPWYSFEIVSLGGEIHFYIWLWPRFRDIVESQLYAQYPGIQIVEAKDYTEGMFSDPEIWPNWSTHFKLTKPEVYPIKTYIDYGLDRNDKEEYRIDPMAAVIEFLGTLKPGEQIWIQILAQAHAKKKLNAGYLQSEPDWTEAAKKEIASIKEKATQKVKIGDQEVPGFPNLTKGEVEAIAAIERSVSKIAYEVMIRGTYIATKKAFNPTHISGLIGSFRQYSSLNMNSIGISQWTDFDYPWEDPFNIRIPMRKRQMIDAYKRRAFFQGKYEGMYGLHPFVLTVEELATIFHFPGAEVLTPTLARIPSVAGEAPSNLPT
jgi:hypothetical protein